jgi:hypothetical protein|tara:strand:+ start:13260 stop:13469 length:210 start_codon:yes stop_codon:yes gene_type:complete
MNVRGQTVVGEQSPLHTNEDPSVVVRESMMPPQNWMLFLLLADARAARKRGRRTVKRIFGGYCGVCVGG